MTNNIESKFFNIQEKKEKSIDLNLNPDKIINKISIKDKYFFILMGDEWIIVDLKENMKQIKLIKIEDENIAYIVIFKVFIRDNYLYLMSNISVIKYEIQNNFKKLEEFKWKYTNNIKRIKIYGNNLILRCSKLLLILDLNNFEELLHIKDNIFEYTTYFNLFENSLHKILKFQNYLIYFKDDYILNMIDWDNKFKITKEFNISIMYKNCIKDIYMYRNYLIFINKRDKKINIIDLNNNFKNITINNVNGYNLDFKFKKYNNLLFILNDKLILVYNMTNYEIKYNIWVDNSLSDIIIIRNLLISYNKKINDFILLDYEKNIFNLNIIKENNYKIFSKFYNKNLIYIEENKLKIKEIKTELNIITENKIINYEFEYKNYGINNSNNLKIYDKDKNQKVVYEKKVYIYLVINNYLAFYINNILSVLNLDNFDDIREKEYKFGIDNMLNYNDILFILTKSEKKFIEYINIKDLNRSKKLNINSDLLSIKIVIDYFLLNYKNSIEILDLKNNMKFLKKIDASNNSNSNNLIVIKNDLMIINNSNYDYINNKRNTKLYFIDINNNFEIIDINEEDLKKCYCIFNNLIIIYNRFTFNVYKKNKNKYELIKYNYIDITSLRSINNYLFIEQNEKITKIAKYENNKFNILKELNEKFEKIYIFENLLYINNKYWNIKIYNIMNNFEEIKEINPKYNINNIQYKKYYLLINTYDLTNIKILLKFDNSKEFIWDKITYNYFLKLNNLKNELNFNLKQLYEFYEEYNILNKSIWFNYIFKINYNIIKYTENPKFLSESLNIFGIDKLYIELKKKFNLIDLIISDNKINIFLEPWLNYYINNNHLYEINYSQFLNILEKIKDKHLFKIFIKYIFQRTYIPTEFRKVKYISINEYKILTSDKLYFDNEKIFNNKSDKNDVKKEFEVFNIPFRISERISDNYGLFEILEKSPEFVKESNFKCLINYYFNKTRYFKYFNIFIYLLLIVSMTINLVNQNYIILILYMICIIYFIFYEIMQFYYYYKTYFKQYINWFDILLIIYNIIIFVYIYIGRFNSINLIIMPLYYLNGYKLINFLKSIDLIRKEIRLFINVIKNTTSFIFFIVIILIYFTNLNFLYNFNNFNKFNLSFFNIYGQMLGNFDDNFNEYKFYDFIELLINTYSFNIILLNLFISVISKVFDNYNENLELYDIQEKINLLQEFSSVYFIIDYINKIIFKSIKKEKYYFFIFETKQKEINLIEINKKLIDSEINIKTEVKEVKEGVKEIVKTEIKEVKTEVKEIIKNEVKKIVKEEVKKVKAEVKEIKTSLNNLEQDIKRILENLKK